MSTSRFLTNSTTSRDLTAGMVVFLVAVPLCLGIALASNAPLLAGILAGVIGGIVVGTISQSQTSVSGPAAALAAIVAVEITTLGSFRAFQLAVVVAGLLQIGLGLARAGAIAAFIPSSVINGLLAAIGLLLVLKQIPHLLGHDADPQGEMAFHQPDNANTFSELQHMYGHIHAGAVVIGLGSLLLMVLWTRYRPLRQSIVPAPLAVVAFGIGMSSLLSWCGGIWAVESRNFVQVPVANDLGELLQFFQWPDFSQLRNFEIYRAGTTIALAASLGSLLNLESVDRLDPQQRTSPPNRELLAQGMGNVVSGMIGGLPMTSEIVRGSVNVNAGSQTKLSTIFHGVLLLGSVVLFPRYLNMIPLSCLAAILLVTGAKLVNPQLLHRMWLEGRYQFAPFVLTIIAIVLTDLLKGVVIGLVISLGFILNSNLRRPIRRIVEKHLGGDVLRIELANQVSFLNRAALSRVLDDVPARSQVLLDAHDTDYIDPDILELIREFKEQIAPARQITVSMLGFRRKYQLQDQVQYLDYSNREIQDQLSPGDVLQILKAGHERFRRGERLTRDLGRQMRATAQGQHPLAVVLSCIDSRTPTELIFDLGLGDILSTRVAGNILTREILGSMEYACAVAKAKLILVMGHTRCGAVTSALQMAALRTGVDQATGCDNLIPIVDGIQQSIRVSESDRFLFLSDSEREVVVTEIASRNVLNVTQRILAQSPTLARLHQAGKVGIVGAIYDVATGEITFLPPITGGKSLLTSPNHSPMIAVPDQAITTAIGG